MTVAALLNQAGHFVASMVCACLCALSLIPMGTFIASSKEGEDDWGAIFAVAFCGVVIVFGASMVGQDDVMLFGRSARDVGLSAWLSFNTITCKFSGRAIAPDAAILYILSFQFHICMIYACTRASSPRPCNACPRASP